MEIERINENTVKFFLSYNDIEERGFTREEVWYNRDKSEELFWEMMDEINEEAEFEVDGPLWIQVHAMNKGIEVTVTRAQTSEDGELEESPFSGDDSKKPFRPNIEVIDDSDENATIGPGGTMEWLENTFYFKEFEDVIMLSSRVKEYNVTTSLYSLDNTFYLHVLYDAPDMDDMQKTDLYSVITEFGTASNMTIHRLEEYGNVIMESDVFTQTDSFFGTP